MKPKNLLYVSILTVISLIAQTTFAQTYRISGRVIEDHSEESIPFVNLFLQGTTTGTTTDMDGGFVLETDQLADSIGVSAIGYKTQFKALSKNTEQSVSFRLLRDDILMDEIVVLAGENPADILLRKIIANKHQNDIDQSDFYQYESYNKLEVDAANLTKDLMGKKLLKPFEFIFENVDSVSEERPFLPLFITETISDYHYRKDPNGQREIIKASKISGTKNASWTQFLGNMYQQFDIYDNFIEVMGKNFASPISNMGLANYKYYLVDSGYIDNKWSYQITFKPKLKQDNAFIGDFWVADTSFAVQRISMELLAKEANINFVNKLSIFQEFDEVNDSIWVLKKDKLIVSFVTTGKMPEIIGRKSTYFKDHLFNDEKTKRVFKIPEDIIVQDGAMDKDESFWATARHDSLSKNEKAIYAMVDSIKQMPLVKTYVDIATVFISGYKEFGAIEVGPYFNAFSSNIVEGSRFRLGVRTNTDFSERMQFKAYGAYGTRDKSFKYGGEALFVLSKKPWQTFHALYQDDLDVESPSAEEFGEDNIFAGLYRRDVPQKLMRIRKLEATYSRDWRWGLSNQLSFSNRRLSPYFDFFNFGKDYDPSIEPPRTITTSEVKLNTRFSYKEKYIYHGFNRTAINYDKPIMNLSYTLGVAGVLDSDFTYHRMDFSLKDWFHVGRWGYTSYVLQGGKIFGTLPFLLLHNHPGNETYFFNTYSFNRMNQYEFVSDTYASLFVTHYFEGFLLNRIPLMRKLKWRSLVNAKIAVGSLSDANIAANTDPSGTHKNFGNFEQMADWQLQTPTIDKPYIEVGAGIENIFHLFRVDAIWRLSYTDTPSKIGIRAGMQLKF